MVAGASSVDISQSESDEEYRLSKEMGFVLTTSLYSGGDWGVGEGSLLLFLTPALGDPLTEVTYALFLSSMYLLHCFDVLMCFLPQLAHLNRLGSFIVHSFS